MAMQIPFNEKIDIVLEMHYDDCLIDAKESQELDEEEMESLIWSWKYGIGQERR